MLDAGDAACAMEVSSHALALERTAGVRFAVAVFTNLTQDHLDFHADMEDYFRAKRSLFVPACGSQAAPAVAVVNVDDPYGARLAAELGEAGEPPLLTFSPVGGRARPTSARSTPPSTPPGRGSAALGPGGEVEVRTPLPGHFNVENALAAIAACHVLGVPRRGRGRGPRPMRAASRGASSRSTTASRSRSWSTTPTPPTRWRTSLARRAHADRRDG